MTAKWVAIKNEQFRNCSDELSMSLPYSKRGAKWMAQIENLPRSLTDTVVGGAS